MQLVKSDLRHVNVSSKVKQFEAQRCISSGDRAVSRVLSSTCLNCNLGVDFKQISSHICAESVGKPEEEGNEAVKPNEPVINQIGVALQEFEGNEEEYEISAKKGDQLRVVSTDPSGWWLVELEGSGKFGYVPAKITSLYNSSHAIEEKTHFFERRYKRAKAAMELLQTERTYVNELRTLVSEYLVPIRSRKLLSPKEISLVFSNIEPILQLNQTILSTFESRFQEAEMNEINEEERVPAHYVCSTDNLLIGDVLPLFSPFFKIYVQLLANGEASMKTLRSTYENKLKTFVEQNCKGNFIRLQSLLVVPVQRITRYPLLFQTILKYTDTDHSDYQALQKSVEVANEICSSINQTITNIHRTDGFISMMSRFEESCKEQLLESKSKKLVKEGKLSEKTEEEGSEESEGEDEHILHCFLTEDSFVVAFEDQEDRNMLRIDLVTDLSELFVLNQESDESTSFQVVCPAGYRNFICESVVGASRWRQETCFCIENLLKNDVEASKRRSELLLHKDKGEWVVERKATAFVERGYVNDETTTNASQQMTILALKTQYPNLSERKIEEVMRGTFHLKKKRPVFKILSNLFN